MTRLIILQFAPLIDMANTVVSFLSGGADILSDIVFTILNLIVVPVFLLLAYILNAFHIILLEAVTLTPRAKDGSGDIVLFGTPSNTPFSSLTDTITNYLEPLSLLLILLGVAVLMFVRIFDVVLDDMELDVQSAQQRLLIAPILILLWPALANMILALGHGLTQIFLNIEVSYDADTFGNLEGVYIPDGGELDFLNYMKSLAGDPLGAGGNDTTMSMIFAIFVMTNATIGYLIGAVAALFRIFAIYMLYVLGPILISMWAFAWRDLSEMGKRYIRYFILFALFPVPAALINTLLPVLVLSIENALMGPLEQVTDGSLRMEQTPVNPQELGSDSPDEFNIGGESGVENPIAVLGLSGIIRAVMIILFPVLIGFAPWVFVIGVNGAMKVAGAATAAVAGVATGGATLAAGAGGLGKMAKGAMDKEGSTISNLKSDASNKASFAKSVGSMGKKYAKNNRSKIQQGAAEVGKMTGGRVGDKVASGLEKELDAEKKIQSARQSGSDIKKAAKAKQNFDDEDDRGQEFLEERLMRDKMTKGTATDIFNANEDMHDNPEALDEDEMKRRAVKKMKEDYKNKSKSKLIDDYGKNLVKDMNGQFRNIKYREVLEKAKELGLDDEVIGNNLASKYGQEQHGVHYSRLNRTIESKGEDFDEDEAEKELDSASDTVKNSMEIDFDELKKDDIDNTKDLLRLLADDGEVIHNEETAEEIMSSASNLLENEDADLQADAWEELDWIDKFENALPDDANFDFDNINSIEDFDTQFGKALGKFRRNNDVSEMQDVAEEYLDEMLHDQSTRHITDEKLDASKSHNRELLEAFVRGEQTRDDDAQDINEARAVNGLLSEYTGSNNTEKFNVNKGLDVLLENMSDEVRKEVEGKIENAGIGENVSELEIDVPDESIETIEDAVQEELFEFEKNGNELVESTEFTRTLDNAGYSEEKIREMTNHAAEMVDKGVKAAQMEGQQALEEIAEDAQELSEETLRMSLEESTMNDAEKEKIINKFKNQNSSIEASDLEVLDRDGLDHINRERIANELIEAEGVVTEQIADELNLSADSVVRNMDDMDARDMSSLEIAEQIGSSELDVEGAANLLDNIKKGEYSSTEFDAESETKDEDRGNTYGGI